MILTGLQSSSKTLPLDGTLAKYQPMDSETIQPLSFGEILKIKEKQLEQEQGITASSVAAALASMQTLSVAMLLPIPEAETSESIAKTGVSDASSSSDGLSQLAATGTSDSTIATQSAAVRLTPTQSADPVSPSFSNAIAGSAAQQVTMQTELSHTGSVQTPSTNTPTSAKANASTSLINQEFTSRVLNDVSVNIENKVSANSNGFTAEVAAAPVTAREQKPAASVVESQVRPTLSATKNTQPTINTDAVVESVVEQEIAKVAAQTASQPTNDIKVSTQTSTVATETKANEVPLQSDTATFSTKTQSSSSVSAIVNEIKESVSPAVAKIDKADTPVVENSQVPVVLDQQPTAFVAVEAEGQKPNSSISDNSLFSTVVQGKNESESVVAQAVPQTKYPTINATQQATNSAPLPVQTESTEESPISEATVSEPKPDKTAELVSTLMNDLLPAQSAISSEIPADESKTVGQEIDKALPSITNVQPDFKVISDTETITQTSLPQDQTFVTMPRTTGHQEIGKVSPQGAQQLEAANISSVESLPDVSFAVPEIRSSDSQPGVKAELNQVTLPQTEQQLPQVEASLNEQKVVGESVKVEAQPNSSMQSDSVASAIKVNLPETENIDLGNKDAKAQIVEQAKVSEPQSAQPSTKTVESKNQEKQISADASATPLMQVVAEPVESNKAAADAEVDAKISGSAIPSVETKEKLNTGHTTSVKKSETVVSDAPMPVVPANDQVIPVSSKPASVEGSKEELKAKQAVKDEEVHPVEKQPKLNQMPDSAAANGSIKEPVAVEHNGNNPLPQANAQATEVVQQVISHINSNIKSGPTSMHLQLNPKELGAIDVQMVSSAQGVHVTFFAEQISTSKLLETQLNQLRESLVDSGVQVSGLNISQHNQSGQKGETFEQSTNFARTSQRDLPQGESNTKETPRAQRRFGQSSEIDYLI